MTTDRKTIQQYRELFPFPWTNRVFASGRVEMLDATGKEVPLLTMIGFLVEVTNGLTKVKTGEPA